MQTIYSNISLLVTFLLIVLSGCNQDNALVPLDDEFRPFVDSFFEEAEKRGLDIKPDDYEVTINFGHDNALHAGVCNSFTGEISINEFHWKSYDEVGRQNVIFHELGHCLLDRRHDNGVLSNGECKSIMKGTEENTCRRNLGNSPIWQKYYIDELFDENTPLPSWYTSEFNKPISETLIDTLSEEINRMSFYLPEFNPNSNYEIVASFENWKINYDIKLSLGEYILQLSNEFINLTNTKSESRYFNREWALSDNTEITFVHYDGLDYIKVDGKMFHIDKLDNVFNSIILSTSYVNFVDRVKMGLQLNLLN